MTCIFCGKENEAQSIEHIVSEAFGNKAYLMKRGAVCDDCNQKFSSFEGKAVSQSVFVMERSRMGIPTKKGGPASGSVGGIKISGAEDFTKNVVHMAGLTSEMVQNFNPANGSFQVLVPTFDGTAVPTSKLLLKMALESLHTSQPKIYGRYDFSTVRAFLLNPATSDWPFMTTDSELTPFISIPTYSDKYKLNIIRCTLQISEVSEKRLLFKFKYGAIPMLINLLDKDGILWMKEHLDADPQAMIYPEHFRAKFEKRLANQVAKAVRDSEGPAIEKMEPLPIPDKASNAARAVSRETEHPAKSIQETAVVSIANQSTDKV